MISIAFLTISPVAMVMEGSFGATDIGKHESTMELFVTDNRDSGVIEWDIPSLERTECIGLTFEREELVDYDGVFSLPKEAVNFLRNNGFVVPSEFE